MLSPFTNLIFRSPGTVYKRRGDKQINFLLHDSMCRVDPERLRCRGSGADPERDGGCNAQEKKHLSVGSAPGCLYFISLSCCAPKWQKTNQPTTQAAQCLFTGPHRDLQAALCASKMLIPEAEIQAGFPSELLGPVVMMSSQAPHFFGNTRDLFTGHTVTAQNGILESHQQRRWVPVQRQS